jgi:hypothetical protein
MKGKKAMNNPNTNRAGWLTGMNRKGLLIRSLGLLLAALFLPVATAQAAVYNFQLQGLNTAADGNGNVIAMTGDGQFDTVRNTVKASGSFTTYDSTGAVVSKGTWVATDFVSFDSYGGVNRGFQTGLLDIDIALLPKGGGAITGLPMTVHCDGDEVPGPAEADNDDGITVGSYTQPTGGFTLFQLIRP